jgi:hypothetical protein
MPDLCAYPPCKCLVAEDDIFCGDVCAMLAGGSVNHVRASTAVPLKSDDAVVPRCACGHEGCGDGLVSQQVN